MPLTVLRQMARCGRLEALNDEQADGGPVGQLAQILHPATAASTKAAQLLSEQEVAKILKDAKDLDDDDYQMLLQYQTSKGLPWRSFDQIPHPPGSLILP